MEAAISKKVVLATSTLFAIFLSKSAMIASLWRARGRIWECFLTKPDKQILPPQKSPLLEFTANPQQITIKTTPLQQAFHVEIYSPLDRARVPTCYQAYLWLSLERYSANILTAWSSGLALALISSRTTPYFLCWRQQTQTCDLLISHNVGNNCLLSKTSVKTTTKAETADF